jgi:GT2 family glycosyltransferase
MVKVAIVILNWNTRELLEKFLPGVLANSALSEVRVFVADNGSTDDSVEYIKGHFNEQIGLIELDRNYGFAEGYNKALAAIEAEYFVLLNTDAVPAMGWLKPLIDAMDGDSLTAACMPKIKSYNDPDFFEYAGAAGGFIDKYGYTFCQGRIFNSIEFDYGQYDKPKNVFWASGACLMLRGPLYKIAGGLDPFFFAHMEEIDLCWRLKNRGYNIRYVPDSVVYHIGGATLPKSNSKKTFLNFRNNLFLLYKNTEFDSLAGIIMQRIALDYVAALRFFFTGAFSDFSAVLKAHHAFFTSYKNYRYFRKQERKFISKFNHPEIYPRSIVIDYFIRKKFTFKVLKWQDGRQFTNSQEHPPV